MKSTGDTILSVIHALDVLEYLSKVGECGISELARTLGCQKSTIFRVVSTLKSAGYVSRSEPGEKYSLTLKVFRIGSTVLNGLDLNRIALPVITRLAQSTCETVHLCILDGDQIVYLNKIESTYSLKVSMMSRIGQGTPFHCTGVGKVLLAWQKPDRLQQYLRTAPLERFTDTTITEPLALAVELQKTRISGCAYDNEEHEAGVRCVASPVLDRNGDVLAAISVSGPSIRLKERQIELVREMVKNCALEISMKMGYTAAV